jgi:hypothetical protein
MFETIYGKERPVEGELGLSPPGAEDRERLLHDTERELHGALTEARRLVWELSAAHGETPRLRAFGNVVIAAIVGLDALEDLDAAPS